MDLVDPSSSVSSAPEEKPESDKSSTMVAMPTNGQEPLLGTHYHVRRTDGSWHVGEVIQRRANHDSGHTEYYVHYKDCTSMCTGFFYMYMNKNCV